LSEIKFAYSFINNLKKFKIMAAKTVVSLCPEKLNFSNQTSLRPEQINSLNFERATPLDPSLKYIAVPQKNFASTYDINGNEVVSQRIWLVGIDDTNTIKTIRSGAINTFRAMALGRVQEGVSAPVVKAVLNEQGKYRTQQGWQYIHAMNDSSFIKAEGDRAVVKNPVVIRANGSAEVYRAKFNQDRTMSVTDGIVDLTTDSMKFYTLTDEKPSAEVVKACVEALQTTCGSNFYALS
jgi:hypothetical protein